MIVEYEEVWREFVSLPPEGQQQVLNFIAFLHQRYDHARSRKQAKQTDLAEESFIGIWHDREDLRDSSAWVRHVRESEWVSAHD